MSNGYSHKPQDPGGDPPPIQVEPLSRALGPMLWLLIPMALVLVYAIVRR